MTAPQMQCITSGIQMKLSEEMIGIVFLQSTALTQPLGCSDPIVQWDMCRGDKEHLRVGMIKNISGWGWWTSQGGDDEHLRLGMRNISG